MIDVLKRNRDFLYSFKILLSIMMRKVIIFISILLIIIVLFNVYSNFDDYSLWMPKCHFKVLFGVDCPNCGNQRALSYFLRGEWYEGIMVNPFLVYMFFCILLYILLKLIKKTNSFQIMVYFYLFGYVVWFFYRNIY